MKGENISFLVNERLREAKVKFMTEHDEKKIKQCIVILYIKETPDTRISDTSNELKQDVVHNSFYILCKAKTYINFTPI